MAFKISRKEGRVFATTIIDDALSYAEAHHLEFAAFTSTNNDRNLENDKNLINIDKSSNQQATSLTITQNSIFYKENDYEKFKCKVQ